jgi:signal transduction histidine kinase
LINSIEAITDVQNPAIRIKVVRSPKHIVMITVTDNGRGIRPEDIGNIFVPYFTTKLNGSGLGLSICRNIIDLHKGQISVKSTPGSVTVVTILI